MPSDKTVAVFGGGIAGLAALYELKHKGVNASLLEQSSRTGGRIKTVYVDNVPVEAGASYFHEYYPGLMRLTRELGLAPYVRRANSKTAVYKDGKVVSLSAKPFVLSSKFSLKDKASVAGLLRDVGAYQKEIKKFVKRMDEDRLSVSEALEESELLKNAYSKKFSEYVKRKVTPTVAKHLVNPVCRRTVFDDADSINTAIGMAVLVPAKTQLYTLDGGMETVTKKLTQELDPCIYLGERVEHVGKDGKKYVVRTDKGERVFDAVISTVPMPDLRMFAPEISGPVEYNAARMTALRGKLKPEYDDGESGVMFADNGYNVDAISRYAGSVFNVVSAGEKEPELQRFFENFEVVETTLWKNAIPKLVPGTGFYSLTDNSGMFNLAGDMYIPCMETSVQTASAAALRIIETFNRD